MLTQLTYPLRQRTAVPLEPSTALGWDEPTSRSRTPRSISTGSRNQAVIPRVALFLKEELVKFLDQYDKAKSLLKGLMYQLSQG